MRIMFEIFSFNVGGIERLLIDMCNNLERRGHNVFLCIINKDYSEELLKALDPSVTILQLNRPVGSSHTQDFYYMRRLAYFVRHFQIEVLHCQGINCVLFSALCKIRSPHTVFVNTVHDSGNYPSYSLLKIAAANCFLNETVAISNCVKDEILARPVGADKVVTIYNAINTRHFHFYDRSCRKHPLAERDTIELINVARFFPAKKGQDLLVEAVEKLLPVYPSLHVTFAGDVFKGQEEAFASLMDTIRAHRTQDHFTFAGDVPNIPALLAKGDIFVLPSRYEGFGIALIEALATGMPAIASNLEGPAEIMARDDLGLLFQAEDADDLARKIQEMIKYYEVYDQKKIADHIAKTFPIDVMVDDHLYLYEKLLGR